MPWIKKNPHLITLSAVALLVSGASLLVTKNARMFGDRFSSLNGKPTPSDGPFELLDIPLLDNAANSLASPASWDALSDEKPMFVPVRYTVAPDTGRPVRLAGGDFPVPDPVPRKKVPNKWLLDHALPVTDAAVLTRDPDGDGFSNADEWRASTDPQDPASHPAYTTKLYLKEYRRVPFRLMFSSYDGDWAKAPEEMQFQINTLDIRTPSQFLKLGQQVVNGKFTIKKFEHKTAFNEKIKEDEDASELTLANNETGEEVVLIKNRVVDSPDSFALFHYVWPNPALDFQVPKLKKFVLLPEKEQFYQLLEVTAEQASVKSTDGGITSIPKIPSAQR